MICFLLQSLNCCYLCSSNYPNLDKMNRMKHLWVSFYDFLILCVLGSAHLIMGTYFCASQFNDEVYYTLHQSDTVLFFGSCILAPGVGFFMVAALFYVLRCCRVGTTAEQLRLYPEEQITAAARNLIFEQVTEHEQLLKEIE